MNPPFATEEQLVQHYARELADAHIKSYNGEVYRIYMMNHFQSAKVDGVKINDVYLRTYHIAGKMHWQMQVDIPDIGRRSWRGGTHYAQLHERSSGEVTIEDHVLAVRKSFIDIKNLRVDRLTGKIHTDSFDSQFFRTFFTGTAVTLPPINICIVCHQETSTRDHCGAFLCIVCFSDICERSCCPKCPTCKGLLLRDEEDDDDSDDDDDDEDDE